MDTKVNFGPTVDDNKIVYVRPVKAKDLPQDLREQVGGLKKVYSVHKSDGAQLAVVKDERLAFVLARQHDLAPVRVH